MPFILTCKYSKLWTVQFHYTPGIYAEGYIVFIFPFVRTYVCSLVHSVLRVFVIPSCSWNYFKLLRESSSSGIYLSNHSSESIHIWTLGTLEGPLLFHDPRVGLEVKT